MTRDAFVCWSISLISSKAASAAGLREMVRRANVRERVILSVILCCQEEGKPIRRLPVREPASESEELRAS